MKVAFRDYASKLIHQKNLRTNAIIVAVLIILFAVLIKLTGRIIGSDDTVLATQASQHPGIFNWIDWRYHTWSGRIFSEGFAYFFSLHSLRYWKAVSILVYAISSLYMYDYYRIFSSQRSPAKDRIMLVVAFLIPYLMQTNALVDGTFWVTGAMYYAWIVTFGLIAMYPVAYFVKYRKLPHWFLVTLGMISTVVASISQEQVGVIIVFINLCFSIYFLLPDQRRRYQLKSIWPVLIFTIISTASFIIGVKSPGDALRLKAETTYWLPDFYKIPLVQHLDYSYRWLLEALINHTGFLLVGCWAFLSVLLARSARGRKPQFIIASVLGIAAVLSSLKGYDAINYWFSFYATWKPALPPHHFSDITFIPWFIVLMCTLIAPIVLYNNRAKGWMLSMLLAAGFGSTLMMLFSPTLYASGWRTLYAPSFVIGVALYILLDDFLITFKSFRRLGVIILGAVGVLALSQYIFLFYHYWYHLYFI